MVRHRSSGAAAELFRPGSAASWSSRSVKQSLLFDGAIVGEVSANRAGDLCDRDSVASSHFRRFLIDHAGGAIGIFAPHEDRPYFGATDWPDLRSNHQLAADGWHHW